MDPFEEELEAEVQKVLDPGIERRRQVAVADLHPAPGLPAVWRLGAVVVGVVTLAAVVLALARLLG